MLWWYNIVILKYRIIFPIFPYLPQFWGAKKLPVYDPIFSLPGEWWFNHPAQNGKLTKLERQMVQLDIPWRLWIYPFHPSLTFFVRIFLHRGEKGFCLDAAAEKRKTRYIRKDCTSIIYTCIISPKYILFLDTWYLLRGERNIRMLGGGRFCFVSGDA